MAQPAYADEDLGGVWGSGGRSGLRLIAGGAGRAGDPPPDDEWSGVLAVVLGVVLGMALAHCLLPWIRLAFA